jgi:ethanolaminephosphotransferase
MGFITEEGLKKLDTYKYKSGGYSPLDLKMNPFWEWCEKLLPRSMAPNTVTLIGFIFMCMSYFCMLYYDYTVS